MAAMIKNPKDFWAGLMYVGVGAAAILFASELPMGSAVRMGPAYFPSLLGGLLILLGAAALIRSLIVPGEGIGALAWREVLLVVAAVVLFGLLLASAGFIVACLVLVLVVAYASSEFRWRPAILLAAGLTVFSVLIFANLLGVPLPLLGSWFGQ